MSRGGNGKAETERVRRGKMEGESEGEIERHKSLRGTHNSCLLLKLPPENGLRRLARNLSKFPGRVIYFLVPLPLLLSTPNHQCQITIDIVWISLFPQ